MAAPLRKERMMLETFGNRLSHLQATISGDGWLDDFRISDIEAQFVCKTFGKHGADVRSFGSRSRGDIFVSESKFSGDIFPVRSCDCLPRGALLGGRPVKVSNCLFRR